MMQGWYASSLRDLMNARVPRKTMTNVLKLKTKRSKERLRRKEKNEEEGADRERDEE